MDFIDFLVDSSDEYLTGTFYARRPKTVEDGGINFTYKQLDPNSKRFGKVLGNVRADVANYAISTNDHCGFNIGGYIVTQNGLIWQITEIVTNEEVKGKSDVLRWFTSAENSEQSLRMIQVEDLFEIEESYNKWCDITVKLKTKYQIGFYAITNVAPTVDLQYTETEIDGGYAVNFKVEKGVAVFITVTWRSGLDEEEKDYTISALKTSKDTLEVTYTE